MDIEFDLAIWPPLPYLPQNIDFDNAQSIGPLDKQIIKTMHLRHWEGSKILRNVNDNKGTSIAALAPEWG